MYDARVSDALTKLTDFFDCCFCDDSPEPIIDSRDRCMHCISNEAKALALELEQQVESLRAELRKHEEEEAALCPEDIGFPEFVRALQKSLEAEQQKTFGICCTESARVRAELAAEKRRADGLEVKRNALHNTVARLMLDEEPKA